MVRVNLTNISTTTINTGSILASRNSKLHGLGLGSLVDPQTPKQKIQVKSIRKGPQKNMKTFLQDVTNVLKNDLWKRTSAMASTWLEQKAVLKTHYCVLCHIRKTPTHPKFPIDIYMPLKTAVKGLDIKMQTLNAYLSKAIFLVSRLVLMTGLVSRLSTSLPFGFITSRVRRSISWERSKCSVVTTLSSWLTSISSARLSVNGNKSVTKRHATKMQKQGSLKS